MARTREAPDGLPTDFFLAGYPDAIRPLADRLRAIVKQVAPDAIERVRPGWQIIGYDLPVGRRTAFFAWVMPENVHVHLGFPQGVFLADPERRLEGAHLRLVRARFVTFEPGATIPEPAMEAFVRDAARIAALSREERLALVLDRE
jgi:hypothetical protein